MRCASSAVQWSPVSMYRIDPSTGYQAPRRNVLPCDETWDQQPFPGRAPEVGRNSAIVDEGLQATWRVAVTKHLDAVQHARGIRIRSVGDDRDDMEP